MKKMPTGFAGFRRLAAKLAKAAGLNATARMLKRTDYEGPASVMAFNNFEEYADRLAEAKDDDELDYFREYEAEGPLVDAVINTAGEVGELYLVAGRAALETAYGKECTS